MFTSYGLLAHLKVIGNFFIRQGVKHDYLTYSGLFFSFAEKYFMAFSPPKLE